METWQCRCPPSCAEGELWKLNIHTCPGRTVTGAKNIRPSCKSFQMCFSYFPVRRKWHTKRERKVSLPLFKNKKAFTTSADLKDLILGFKSRINDIIIFSTSSKLGLPLVTSWSTATLSSVRVNLQQTLQAKRTCLSLWRRITLNYGWRFNFSRCYIIKTSFDRVLKPVVWKRQSWVLMTSHMTSHSLSL